MTARRRAGPPRLDLEPRRLLPRLRASSAVRDRPFAWGALAGLLANLALYGYVWSVLPGLPELMPLHYDPTGTVDQIGRSSDLFRLPIVGSLVLTANLLLGAAVHVRERPAAHVLLWAALGVQVVLAGGIWLLISKAAGE